MRRRLGWRRVGGRTTSTEQGRCGEGGGWFERAGWNQAKGTRDALSLRVQGARAEQLETTRPKLEIWGPWLPFLPFELLCMHPCILLIKSSTTLSTSFYHAL